MPDDFEQTLAADRAGYQKEIDQELIDQRAQNERARAAVEAARQQREPEWDALKKRQADVDAVPPPQLEKPPTAPKTQEMLQPTSLQKTFGMASIFALLSVGLAKGNAIYGLKALGGFMEGAHAGNVEQAKAAHEDFVDKMAEVHATNENALKEYNAIIGNKKFSLEAQEHMYRMKALEFNDELGLQAQTQGGMNAVTALNKQRADVDFKMLAELDRRRRVIEMERHNKAIEGKTTASGLDISSLPAPVPGQKNEALLQKLQPAEAELVRRMASGDLPVSGFGGLGVKQREKLLELATLYDPNFNARQYGVMDKTAKEFTPGGPVGTNVLAINTMAHHINDFAEQFDKLDNSQLQKWNAVKNKLATQFGDPALQRLQVPALATAGEMARIIKGGRAAPTDDEMKAWEGVFNTSMSKGQAKAVVWQALQTAGGRLSSIEDAYKQTMGKDFGALSPDTTKIIMSHKPKDAAMPSWLMRRAGAKKSLEETEQEAGRQEKEFNRMGYKTATNPKTGQRMILKDGQWQPLTQ